MAEKYHPDRATIGSLLDPDSTPIKVPDWQRNYSWTNQEFETFWADVLNFFDRFPGENIREREYFLGTCVLVDAGGHYVLVIFT